MSSARPARTAIADYLPGHDPQDWKLDLVVVNGENAAGGFGTLTEAIYQDFIDARCRCGHARQSSLECQKEALVFIERAPRLSPSAEFSTSPRRAVAAGVDTKDGRTRWSSMP